MATITTTTSITVPDNPMIGNDFNIALKKHVIRSDIAKVCTLLSEDDVRTMIIKGFALDYFIYKKETDRLYSDVDIYIHHDDLSQAIKSLEKLGYQNIRGWIPTSIAKQIPMRKIKYGITIDIDLHYDLTIYPLINEEFNFDETYKRSLEITTDTFTFKTFSLIDSLKFSYYHLLLEKKIGTKDLSRWEKDIVLLQEQISDTRNIENLFSEEVRKTKFWRYLIETSSSHFSYKCFQFNFSNNKLRFITETFFPPSEEISFNNKYKNRIYRLLGVKKSFKNIDF